MTSTSADRIAVVGTGLIGTSIAMAASRIGGSVTGWDLDPAMSARAAERASLRAEPTLEAAVADARIVVVCAPIPAIPELVARVLAAAPTAMVTDAGSIKAHVVDAVGSLAGAAGRARFVGGHPIGGSARSGP
ncbi:MAG: prephenate dehydrogenase/arogenate dehydrogenase family protein, partial [Actinomycetota bacterium]